MSDQSEKLARVLDFLAKGLDSLGEQLQETSKAIAAQRLAKREPWTSKLRLIH
jgi:hypothetical protein